MRVHPILRSLVLYGGLGALLIGMAFYGGTARPGPLFNLGVVLFTGALLAFFGLVWWLYFSPLPPAKVAAPPGMLAQRQVLAILVAVTGLAFCTGTFWDEIWHRLYGVGETVADFWWRPHIMMYASMGLMALFALGGFVLLLGQQGGWRMRFRSASWLGMLGLTSAYLVISAPIDELWHRIYGLDITAWSLPHIMFAVGTTLVMLAGVALQVSIMPSRTWATAPRPGLGEALVLFMLMVAELLTLQITITEWEVFRPLLGSGPAEDAFTLAFLSRPEWMYPTAVLGVTTFFSHVAVLATRRPGSATALALGVWAFRWSMVAFFGLPTERFPIVAHVLIIAPALALDVWYAARRAHADTNGMRLLGPVLMTLAFGVVSLPLLSQWLDYPRVTTDTVPLMALAGLLMAWWSAWLGNTAGEALHAIPRESATVVQPRLVWVGVGALAAYAVLSLAFILTASPPV